MMETPEGRKDFNERTGRNEYWKLKGHELDRYMWWEAGAIQPKYVYVRDCPLCGANPENSECLWKKEGLYYARCNHCGMTYISTPLKTEVLEEAYESSESMRAWLEVLKNQEDLDQNKFEYLLGHIDKHIDENFTESVKVLDVGASYGFFCHVAHEWGWEPTGLELSEEAFEVYMKRYYNEFSLYKQKLEDYLGSPPTSGKVFDVVTFWEVLEHIPDPGTLLFHARNALVEDGLLGLLVPNMNSRTARYLHEEAKMFGANHLNYWNIDTLTRQLDVAGFDVLESGTLIGDVNTWYNYLNFEEPYSGNLVHPDHEKVTKDVLASGEGYKLWVVARKKEGGGPSVYPR